MASRYWVGGTAAWDGTAGTKWALTSGGAGGQAIPTSADDVFFTNLSTGPCTVSVGNTGAKSITCTGYTGSLTGTANITVSGSVLFVAGMSLNLTGTMTLAGTGTLTSAGKTFNGNITINGAGITVTLGDALTMPLDQLTLTQGTFTTSNFAVSVAGFISSGALARTINLGSSAVTIQSDWQPSSTNFTVNAGTSTITFTSSGNFFGLSKTYNNVSFTGDQVNNQITGANIFNNVTVSAPTGAGITTLSFDSNQTITTMVCAGAAANSRIMLQSNGNTLGTPRTLTITTWTTVSDVDFRDITLTNAKSGTRLGDCGGNTNITFVAAKTVYWNLAGTQSWNATGWATTSGGVPAANNFPLAQDTTTFNNTGGAGTVSIDNAYNIGTVVMSARTSAMTLSLAADPAIYGNWTNGTGLTLSGISNRITFTGRTTQTITSNGKAFGFGVWVDSVNGTVVLADALSSSCITDNYLRGGTLDLNGFTFTCTVQGFNAVLNLYTRNITFNGGSIQITGAGGFAYSSTLFSTTAGTGSGSISISSTSGGIFSGSGGTFNCALNIGYSFPVTVSGANTFLNITNTFSTIAATTLTLGANQTVSNFTASGTAGKLFTLNSSVAGTARTLTKTSGTVGVNYLSIQDSTATGGAAWYAGANSTNVSNNTGWIFANAPLVSGNFLMMFM